MDPGKVVANSKGRWEWAGGGVEFLMILVLVRII